MPQAGALRVTNPAPVKLVVLSSMGPLAGRGGKPRLKSEGRDLLRVAFSAGRWLCNGHLPMLPLLMGAKGREGLLGPLPAYNHRERDMFVTPQEAGQRWCPFGRQATVLPNMGIAGINAVVAANRQPNGDVPSCLGPLCMAWRYEKPKPVRELDMVSGEVMDEEPRRGYCGLAGRPTDGE